MDPGFNGPEAYSILGGPVYEIEYKITNSWV
jgi:hypothetical protein